MNDVSCGFVLDQMAAYIDGALEPTESLAVRRHVEACTVCSARIEEQRRVALAVRSLGRKTAPPGVTTVLQVIASQERTRQKRFRNAKAFVNWMAGEASLRLNNLMRPFAIPVAGGVAMATLVFSMIVSSYPLGGSTLDDVPTQIYTEAVFKGIVPFDFARHDVIVDLIIDSQGRVLDYRIAGGSMATDPSVRRSVENILLFTEFKPATSFGQRIAGRVRISFQTGRIEVRG